MAERLKRTTFQARLGRKMDNIARKLTDNQITLTAHPTDMLRVEAIRDEQSQDLISRRIAAAEVIPIIFPNMVDIPLRHFISSNGDDIIIPSLYTTPEQQYFEIYAPVGTQLMMDDLLIRILNDPGIPADQKTSVEGAENAPYYVMALQVKEILGTFGYSSLRWMKYFVTFYDESLPKQVITQLQTEANKRLEIKY